MDNKILQELKAQASIGNVKAVNVDAPVLLEIIDVMGKQEQALTDSNASLMEQTELAVRCRQQAETLEAENTRLVAQMATMQHKPQPTPGVGPCAGLNCGATDGVSHSVECAAEHAAVIAGGRFVPKGAQAPTVKQIVAQLSSEKWTIAEQKAFAPFLAQFPNECSQGIISLGSAWKHGIAYAQSLSAQHSRYIRPEEIVIEGRTVDGSTVDLPIFGDGSKDGKRLFIVALHAPQQHAQAPQQEGSRPAAYSEMSLGELLERYWNIAFSEGQDGVSRDSEAQEVLSALMAFGKDAQAALSDSDIRKAVASVQPEDFNGVVGVDFLSYDVAIVRAFIASHQPGAAHIALIADESASSRIKERLAAAPAIQQEELRQALIDLASTQRELMEANAELAAIRLKESAIQQKGAALDERAAFEKHFGDQGFDILTETDKNGEHYALNTVRAYWVGWSARAALAAPARAEVVPDPRPLFERKLADLQQRGYEIIGRILHKDGEYALFDSSCRWLTKPQYQRLMHEQNGSLFAAPSPAQVQPVAVPRERLQNWIDVIHDNERSMGDRLQSLSSIFGGLLRGDALDKYPLQTIREQQPDSGRDAALGEVTISRAASDEAAS